MLKPDLLKKITEQLVDALPSHVQSLKNDFEKTCQRILNTTFNQFGLVTREEFDIQSKVLARTRQKLEALEKQLHELKLKDRN